MKNYGGRSFQFLTTLAAVLFSAALARTAQAAAFFPTGPLNSARDSHTATLLANGKVLVIGGYGNGTYPPYLSSAELFDPATGMWTMTGPAVTPHSQHTATLLPNGKVLVAGGCYVDYDSHGVGTFVTLASAELYDPATGTWAMTGAMSHARYGHTATLLPSGKVLVAGGLSGTFPDDTCLSGAELYDPDTGTWTPTGDLQTPLAGHTATLLANGKVLVAGGGDGVTDDYTLTELYDPASGTWAATGHLSIGRNSHTATLLPNGKVLVAGGYASGQTTTAELYDPAAGTWTATSALAFPRSSHSATLLPSGQVLVVGGYYFSYPGGGVYLTTAEVYDPATGTWSAPRLLSTARGCHTATLLPSGQVLLAGGKGGGDDLGSAELYDSAGSTWAATGSLTSAHGLHAATLLTNGQVLVTGGDTGTNGLSAIAELFNPAGGNWVATSRMSTKRSQHTTTLLANGQVLAAGGQTGTSSITNSAELYDPTAGTWTLTSPMNIARYEHTATLLANGQVLVAGGADDPQAELYNPATRHWTPVGSLANPRRLHKATLLPNGKVLVTGGYYFGSLSSAELYDAITGTWATTSAMNAHRWSHTATLLPNGKVLAAGGAEITGFSASAELYDPEAGTWTPTGAMTLARFGHTATLLSNGKVLVAGGTGGGQTTELYDPATGTWTAAASVAGVRSYHSATLLPNGQVLIAGGHDGTNFLASAELYSIGLGFSPAWQPQLGAFTSPLALGSSLVLTGSGFRGISEGSCGNSQDSPADYPVVQLRSVESGQTVFLPADARARWSATSFTSMPLDDFPLGYALVTVFANGIPSSSGMLRVDRGVPANRLPVVRCTNVVVSAGPDCHAAASVDNGSYDPDGDPITLTQTPPGPYPLGNNVVTLTATDSQGASSSGTALVIVQDTTPPALACPSDMVVEFSNEIGATVFFTVLGSDNCSGVLAVEGTPVSGSTFPIGTTLVRSKAVDGSGNLAICGFQITVLGAQGVKSNVLAELTALRAGRTRPPEHQHLDDAIRHLGDSLDSALWIDQTHLNRRHGERDFHEEKAAVQALCELLKDKRGAIPQSTLPAFINRIIKADRLLASVALQDATTAGADPELLAQASHKLARGDQAVGRGKYQAGIEHYREVWQAALRLNTRITGRLVNGGLSLEFPAFSGERYVIEASTNLTHWVTLGTVTATDEGTARFDGSKTASPPIRFYRAKLLP